MKTLLLLCSLLINVAVLNASNQEEKKIKMKGKYEKEKSTFITSQNSLTVTLDDASEFSVNSTCDIPFLSVTIIKDGMIVDENTFSLKNGDTETFLLKRYEAGTYSVLLTTPTGTYLNNDFVIE